MGMNDLSFFFLPQLRLSVSITARSMLCLNLFRVSEKPAEGDFTLVSQSAQLACLLCVFSNAQSTPHFFPSHNRKQQFKSCNFSVSFLLDCLLQSQAIYCNLSG